MSRVLITVFAILLLCGSLLGQSPQSPGSGSTPPGQQAPSAGQPAPSSTPAQTTASTAPAGSVPRVAPGSVIPVKLVKSIDAKKAKSGDEVIARVTQDLLNSAGAVIIPKDSKILGHVTEARARSKEQQESQVAIAFDRVLLKNGEQMQMPMSIQAIVAPPNRDPNAAPGADQPSSYPGAPAGQAPAGAGGRSGPMGGMAPQAPGAPPAPGSAPTGSPGQQPITGETQGVVGIPNLKLSAAPDPAQGSLMSSEKNNVKLDDGTFLLLRVN